MLAGLRNDLLEFRMPKDDEAVELWWGVSKQQFDFQPMVFVLLVLLDVKQLILHVLRKFLM
jgi:hypothetical protein